MAAQKKKAPTKKKATKKKTTKKASPKKAAAARRNGRKGGRPKIQWDARAWRDFERACRVYPHANGIATAMGVHFDAIDRLCREKHGVGFREYLDKTYGKTRVRLAAKQIHAAIEMGNPTMLIWLGKNQLGQTDKRDVTTTPILPAGSIVLTAEQLAELPTDALRAIRSVIATGGGDEGDA